MDHKELSLWTLDDFPLKAFDKVRYQDTDRQGHVNNASFSAFFETGRVELLYHPEIPLHNNHGSFVIVSAHVHLINELYWPGKIDIGTAVIHIGNSSIQFAQALYQNGVQAATALTVIVHVDNQTKKATSLSSDAKEVLSKYLIPVKH